jgi:Uma2 family endonuclease
MSTEITEKTTTVSPVLEWENPLHPTDLIFDDGEPLESNRHRIAMNVLIWSILTAMNRRNDYFVGGNMFIYYSSKQVRNQDFRGPDFFVVLDVDGSRERQGWVVWEENGRYPDVIVELMSPSTASVDIGAKKDIYERIFRTSDYFVYDPFNPNSLRGWHLDIDRGYQELTPNEQGWLWCQRLGLWLGNWQGTIQRETTTWLRFYDNQGNLVPLLEEVALQQGLEQGLQQGLEQGLQQGTLRQLLKVLKARFAEISPEVELPLQTLTIEQLEELVDIALGVNSLAEFQQALEKK